MQKTVATPLRGMIRTVMAGIVILDVVGGQALAQVASFDCKRPGTKVETMICGDPLLSDLDDLLHSVYRSHARPDDEGETEELNLPDKVVDEQKRWLVTRNGCGDAACLETQYEARIDALASCPSGRRGLDPQCKELLEQADRALQRVEVQMETHLAKRFAEQSNAEVYVPTAQDAFRHAQIGWRSHRDAECAYLPLRDGMSFAYTAEVEFLCKIQMTRKRRRELRDFMAATEESR